MMGWLCRDDVGDADELSESDSAAPVSSADGANGGMGGIERNCADGGTEGRDTGLVDSDEGMSAAVFEAI